MKMLKNITLCKYNYVRKLKK